MSAGQAAQIADADECEVFVRKLIDDPSSYPDLSLKAAFSLSREQRERIALAGLKRRFSQMRERISALDRIAGEQGVSAIDSIETGAYVLFPHTVYKSYPLTLLERGQFDRLTRWIQGLTTLDLSGFSSAGIETIDDWIRRLNDEAGLQVVHTSGTTGKLSFLPRATADEDHRLKYLTQTWRDWDGPNSGPDVMAQPYPVITPSYWRGATAPHRTLGTLARRVARSPDNILGLYDDWFSADVISLAGRLRAAEARGEAGQVRLPPALMARREEYVRRERERPQAMERFFAEAIERFAGRDVIVLTVLPIVFDWAEEGLKRGLRGLFGPGSILNMGGGSKGRVLPDDAEAMIKEFLGFDTMIMSYGMSEKTGISRRCEHGHYHIAPYIVPYALDPDSGEPLPRSGSQTGRFGFVDLAPSDHWGGFITGDKVTLSGWDAPCACGRTGPYVHDPIQRFSELQGGDDKISCAGAPEAHDKAIEYLASMAQ